MQPTDLSNPMQSPITPPAPSETSDREFYDRTLTKRGNPPMDLWGRMALDHWRKHLPELYADLVKSRCATQAAILAQEDARDMYALLVEQGMDARAAQEIALKEYVLLDPPEPETEQDREEGENNQLAAFNNFLASLNRQQQTPPQAPPTT